MRPFEPLNMNTSLWMQIQPEPVEIGLLIPTQQHLYADAPKGSWCGDEYVHVVLFEGRFYISDGHHRVTRALQAGLQFINARVKRLSYPKESITGYNFRIQTKA